MTEKEWEARQDDVVIGTAKLWSVHGPKCRAEILVAARYRRRGHGTRLLAQVLDGAREAGARSVQVRPLADDADSIAFASKRGFVETMRMFRLELVLAEARTEPYLQLMDRLAGDGIAIVTLADFDARTRRGEDAYRDVFVDAQEGWPDPDPDPPGEPTVPVDWLAILRSEPDDPTIVAEQRGRLVGFTGALGTGVRPELRGRGIATAMKVAAIDAAIARGETTMRTATGHPALRHINEKLGFRETGCELRMVLRL